MAILYLGRWTLVARMLKLSIVASHRGILINFSSAPLDAL